MAEFDLQRLGRQLQGAGAGFQGRGEQFLKGLREERQLEQKEKESARQRFLRGVGGATQMIRSGDLMGAVRLLDSIDDPNAQRAARELLAPQTSEETALDLFTLERRAIVLGDLKGPEAPKQQIVDGQMVTFGDTPTATKIAGFEVGEDAAGTEQRFFESLLEKGGLDKKQKKKAIAIKLRLEAGAVSNAILSAIASGDIDSLSDARAQIKQAEKFAELTGASRAKTIDKGFERITKIDAGILNIDRAVDALNQGAGVGAIQRLFPSIRAASVALDNIQGLMALDVIGAVTFGALSKGELDLAKLVALPTGLDTPQLIQHLQDKKVAQQKLRDYFNEQIQFLDRGGTVAGFLRRKEEEQGGQAQPQIQQQQPQAQTAQPQTQRLVFNPQTGQLEPK